MSVTFNSYSFLDKPVPVIEQRWPDGTLPLVSVSCLVYNHINYIEFCIKQLLQQQTSFPIEFIFHDDASTDGSVAILKKYAQEYPQLIKLVLQAKNTYHSNISKIEIDLHKLRRGKYIANCEGDDYWIDPLKLEKQVKFLENHSEFAGIHTKVEYVDSNGTKVGVSNKVTPTLAEADFGDLVLNSIIHSVSYMYRSDVLVINGQHIWNLSNHYYDQYLFLVTALHGKIKYLDEITSAYRINVGVLKTWNRFSKAKYTEECIEFFNKMDLIDDWRIACFLKLKSVYAILYCGYVKSNNSLGADYFKKYVNNLHNLYKIMPFNKFLSIVFSVEFILLKGLLWHFVIFISMKRILPKGIT
jgi:glycosyltransferase involved in cell wall biosynthesis